MLHVVGSVDSLLGPARNHVLVSSSGANLGSNKQPSCSSSILTVKRRQGDVPWDAVHRTLKLQYQPRRKVYTDDAVIAEPV